MKALNIKEEFKALSKNKVNVDELSEEERNEIIQERGLDFVFTIIEKMPNAEREIKSFLALYSEQSIEDIEALSIEEFMELVRTFLKEPSLLSFFKQAAK
jgi:hypothetical protein